MEEKKDFTTPLDEKDLSNVAAGGEGETTQIRIGPGGGGGFYRCCACGCLDFYIIGSDAGSVTVRCKNCNTVSRVSQM